LVQQGLFGFYLGCSFAPNHKGMPILDAADRSDFLRRQVLTSRNVRGGWLTDFALGGLNYQIEHHLFPSMPRPNLRRSHALIEAFCRQHDLPYCQASLAGSYAQALRHLNACRAVPVRSAGRAQLTATTGCGNLPGRSPCYPGRPATDPCLCPTRWGCGCPRNRQPAPAIGGRPSISSGAAPSACG
jgi:hypothetical protein